MRRRTTVLLPPGQALNPKTITVNDTSLNASIAGGTLEERATWNIADLPDEVHALQW